MFSQEYDKEIRQYFDERMDLLKARCAALGKEESKLPEEERGLLRFGRDLLEQKTEEIEDAFSRCGEEEGQALRFLYSSMPLSDLLNYPAAVFMAYAAHGVFLWREGPFAGKVPEKLFANYVLHHRVHNEDIADTRRFFYEMLKERTAGKSMYEAAMEANFWCGENATYQSTFMRTQNPVTMYGTAAGRCGEEAPFAVTALRCLGIPAREVAAPFWAHCDDNHAWVEAWCDGKWHFLGGCEPSNRLDEGWFAGPASRAMLIDSTWFGKDTPCEPVAGSAGMARKVNHMALYANTAKLTVRVEDEQGRLVPGARVDFTVLNFGRFNSVATLYTGAETGSADYGAVSLDIGYGDMLVSAAADGGYGEILASMTDKKQKVCTIVLKKEMQALDVWREIELRAPAETPRNEYKTEEENAAEHDRLEHAAKCRQRKMAGFYPEREAERVLLGFAGKEREEVQDILLQACANAGEIIRFLEWDFAGQTSELCRVYGEQHWKVEALKTLQKNDYWDIRAEVLAECSILASPYAGAFPEEIFFRDLLCPCVSFEMARPGRAALLKALGALQERIRENPRCLPAMLERWMISLPEEEYANLVTSPAGCLAGGIAGPHSRMVLCANILRALGIPVRMRMIDRTLEYYADGRFFLLDQPVSHGESAAKGKIVVQAREPLKLEDWRHYSLSRFEEGRFLPLFIRPGQAQSGQKQSDQAGSERAGTDQAEFELEQGIYRIVTTNRLPDGGQFVKLYDFRLQAGETKQIRLSMREIPVEALLNKTPVKDIPLYTPEGGERMLSDLGGNGRSLFLWLELAKEPTEHILNELCEKQEQSGRLAAAVYFVVRKGMDYKGDVTLQKACAALPGARVLLDDFGENYKELAFGAGRDDGKFPLALILENGKECIYSDSGYKVGMSEPLLRILAEAQPFAPGCMGSRRFRIPSLLVTGKGNLLAVCDARWNHGLDSAGNLETVAARSVDNGYSWERQFVNHFDDVEDGSDRCIFSAGFIDPVLGKDSQGTLYLLTDLCPAFVGGYAIDGIVCGQQNGGRHPGGRLALRDMESYTHAEPLELNEETYPYYAGEPGTDGYLPVLRLSDDQPYGDYVLDDEMYLYRRAGETVEKVMIPQLSGTGEKTSHMIHANIFFAASPVKAYPAFHIVCRVSRDDGKTWSRMRFVDGQIGGRGFTAVCPGKGYACMYQGKERMIFPIYDNNLGTEFASVIYTEDGGLTWRRGQRAKETGFLEDGAYVKSSESQIVEMPDGSLRMYSRNLIREITYADSLDGGETWSEYRREPKLRYCGNCMVSVINYSRRIEGKNVLLASYPEGDDEKYHRVNGRIAVGFVDEETKNVDWKYHYPVNQAPFYYSCLTELPDGRIALWYEYEEYAIRLETFSMEQLMREER